MISIRKTLILACLTSVLGFGAAYAQTDPAAAPAAPAATDPAAAPAATPDKPMMKKHMAKKHKKHMMKKKAM